MNKSDKFFFSVVGITLACHIGIFVFKFDTAYGVLANLGMIALLSGYLLVSDYHQLKSRARMQKPNQKEKL